MGFVSAFIGATISNCARGWAGAPVRQLLGVSTALATATLAAESQAAS